MNIHFLTTLIIVITATTGCISVTLSSEDDNKGSSTLQKEISETTRQKVKKVLGSAVAFVKESEKTALAKGRVLTKEEQQYALNLGIKHPEKIRIQHQFRFPAPHDPELLAEFNKLGFGSILEGGRTNGYGIFLKPYVPNQNSIIQHELVHVKQMETMGLKAFIKRYLEEALTYDYFSMPLEVEAFNKTPGESY